MKDEQFFYIVLDRDVVTNVTSQRSVNHYRYFSEKIKLKIFDVLWEYERNYRLWTRIRA